MIPGAAARERWTPASTTGWGVRLGLHLVKGIGEQHEELLDAELAHGPYVSLADVVERTGLPEETIERLIRTGALDSLGRPRRELLWQLREVTGASRGSIGTGGGRRGAARCERPGRRATDGSPAARHRGAAPAADHRAGAARRCLRGGRARRAAPGDLAVPRRAGSPGRGRQRRARGAATRSGSDRRPRGPTRCPRPGRDCCGQ